MRATCLTRGIINYNKICKRWHSHTPQFPIYCTYLFISVPHLMGVSVKEKKTGSVWFISVIFFIFTK